MEAAGEDNLVHMAKGNGTFVVAELVERITTEGEEGHRRQLAEWFSQDVRADIGNGKTKGSDILLDRLKDLDSNL